MGNGFIAFIFVGFLAAPAFSATDVLLSDAGTAESKCSMLLSERTLNGLVRQIRRLNPDLIQEHEKITASEIYLRLEREYDRFEIPYVMPDGSLPPGKAHIPEALAEHIRSSHSDRYHLESASRPQVQRFYSNSLQYLSWRASRVWLVEEVTALAGRKLSPELEAYAIQLLNSHFAPYSIVQLQIPPVEKLASLFRMRPWATLPWPEVLDAVGAWMLSHPEGARPVDFLDWLKARDPDLSMRVGRIEGGLYRVWTALTPPIRAPDICPNHKPACSNCPLNLACLRK